GSRLGDHLEVEDAAVQRRQSGHEIGHRPTARSRSGGSGGAAREDDRAEGQSRPPAIHGTLDEVVEVGVVVLVLDVVVLEVGVVDEVVVDPVAAVVLVVGNSPVVVVDVGVVVLVVVPASAWSLGLGPVTSSVATIWPTCCSRAAT